MGLIADLEHHEPHHQADEERAPGKAKKGDRQHRDNLLIIAGTFGVLIISYLIWRSNSKGRGPGAQTYTSGGLGNGNVASPGGSQGAPSAYQDQYLQQISQNLQDSLTANQQAQSDAWSGFQSYLQTLAADLVNLRTPAPPGTSTGTPPGSSSAPAAPIGTGTTAPGGLYTFGNDAAPGPMFPIANHESSGDAGYPRNWAPPTTGVAPGTSAPPAGAVLDGGWWEGTILHDPQWLLPTGQVVYG